jgi:hypothetical protein
MAEKASSKLTVKQHRLTSAHKGHASHMCELVAKRKMADVAKLAKGAKYVCHICGRAAAQASSLCEAVEL